MVTKINIISCDEYEITGKDGNTYKGFNCNAIKPNESVIRFSTKVDHSEDVVDVDEYDAEQSVEIDLNMSVWEGKKKYKEAESSSLD